MSGLVHREWVQPDWLDYNGHLSEAFYVLVFGHATDALMDRVGLDGAYRERSGCSLYTVEAHVRYLREVPGERELAVATGVVAVERKRVHVCHEMRLDDDVVATEELIAVHVDKGAARASPLPEQVYREFEALRVPAPEYAGRAIGLRRQGS